MLASEENFALAINASGIEMSIPRREVSLSAEWLSELDALSERPEDWGALVAELREIRRAVEAGVVVTADGARPMKSWQGFYSWAHGRYHMLEDGYDDWIGDDA